MTPRLSLALLGPFEIRLDAELVDGFDYNKVRALLAYLTVEAGQPHTRAHLCALLWPSAAERAARQSLSQALTRLHKALGDANTPTPFLLSTSESLQLNPAAPVEVDVSVFGARLAEAEAHAPLHRGWRLCTPCAGLLSQAAALYRGDFLAPFFLNDSAPFEEWALLVRERQRQRMLTVLERLAAYAERRGAYARAAEYTRRQVDLEPLLEVNHRAAMRRLALDGQTAAALAQFQGLRRTLAAELGAEPEPETTALYSQIQAGAFPGPADGAHRLWALPLPSSRLIGRERDLQLTLEHLRQAGLRALTLTGPPGIGKTRLALELAHVLRFDFEDGACFVELAPVNDAALVPAAVAQALDVREQSGRPLAAVLQAALKDRHVLLVLDNFEHVLEAAPFVAELLAACPDLKLLATSRSPLHIRAEHQYGLAPLALPDAAASPEAIATAPAVALFVERVQAVRPGFALTPAHAGPVLGICAQLDGLPLAIELIAARAKTLAPAELLRQLEHGLDALTHGSRDLPERQRTLSRSIAWSYDRLSPDAQRVFACLGVFTGGCMAEAAQAVVGGAVDALPALEALAESSLIQAQSAERGTRFTLLETLRAFALERLAAIGDMGVAERRHAAFFRALAERVEPELVGPDQKSWFGYLELEFPNLRAALSWSSASSDPAAHETGLCLAAALEQFWEVKGRLWEGRRWLEAALRSGRPASPAARAKALRVAGRSAIKMADPKGAEGWLLESVEVFRQLQDSAGLARALFNLGLAIARQGNSAVGGAHIEESLELAQSVGDEYVVASVYNALAEVADRRGDQALCRQYTERALALNQARRDPRNSAGLLLNLGLADHDEGAFRSARQHIEASLAAARELGDQQLIALGLLNLGNVLIQLGEPAEARVVLEQAIAQFRVQHNEQGGDGAYGALGRALEKLGDLAGARAAQRQGLRLRVQISEPRAIAVSLTNLARLDQHEGHSVRAAQLLGAAEAIRVAIGSPITTGSREEYAQFVASVKSSQGDAAFSAAWAVGAVLTQAEAVALALG